MAVFIARDQDSYQITAVEDDARHLVERRTDIDRWVPVAVCSTLGDALRYVKEFAP